ncbi:effector protein NopP, partial [Mesorhizobium sp. M2D.F.Ca.ET.225.01.1.1]
MNEFESESWREQFPGRTEVTSIVDLQVAHPLVENAGDILLEHQLRIDGDRPLLNWRAANPEAQARAQTMGFVEVDHGDLVLD